MCNCVFVSLFTSSFLMANQQDGLLSSTNETVPLKRGGGDYNDIEDDIETASFFSGCGCFRNFCRLPWQIRRRKDSNSSTNRQQQHQEERRESWLMKKAKDLKEMTEIVAGPKWKNFIRRISNYNRNKKMMLQRKLQFQYDPRSYSLNFDERIDMDFPTRFPPPVVKNGKEFASAACPVVL